MATLRAHTIIFAAIILLGIIFILPFAITLLLAAITAYALHPFVHRLEKITRSYHLALIAALVIIMVPFAVFFSYVAGDITPFLHDIRSFSGEINLLIELARLQLSAYGLQELADILQNVLRHVTDYLMGKITVFVQNIPNLLVNIAIYIFATYHFIKDGDGIVNYARQFAGSLELEENHLLTSIMKGLKNSFDVLFISYASMSVITGGLAWVGYTLAGVPYPAFLAFLSGLFAFLPVLGVWMIYVPATIYEYSLGNTDSALFVILYGFFVLTVSTDMIIRPALGMMKTGVNPLTIFLGFFAGPMIVGAPGVIIGPIVFVLVETVVREYIDFTVQEKKAKKSPRAK